MHRSNITAGAKVIYYEKIFNIHFIRCNCNIDNEAIF